MNQQYQLLRIEHIEKYYGNKGNLTKALDDISFEVQNGEFIAIMGASGSGKTTLLNCISTIDTVSAGHIFLRGIDITEIEEKSLLVSARKSWVYLSRFQPVGYTYYRRKYRIITYHQQGSGSGN